MALDDTEVQELMAAWNKQLEKRLAEMNLRQKCLEMALKCDGVPPVALAKEMLEFLYAPLSDVFKTPTG